MNRIVLGLLGFLLAAGVIVGILFAVGVFSLSDPETTATASALVVNTRVYQSDLTENLDNTIPDQTVTFVNRGMFFTTIEGEKAAYAAGPRHFYSDNLSEVLNNEFTISFRVYPANDLVSTVGMVLFAFNKVGPTHTDNVLSVETNRLVYNNITETDSESHAYTSNLKPLQWTRVIVRMRINNAGTASRFSVMYDGVTVLDVDLAHIITIPDGGVRLNMLSDYDGTATDSAPLANGNFFKSYVQDLNVYNTFESV